MPSCGGEIGFIARDTWELRHLWDGHTVILQPPEVRIGIRYPDALKGEDRKMPADVGRNRPEVAGPGRRLA